MVSTCILWSGAVSVYAIDRGNRINLVAGVTPYLLVGTFLPLIDLIVNGPSGSLMLLAFNCLSFPIAITPLIWVMVSHEKREAEHRDALERARDVATKAQDEAVKAHDAKSAFVAMVGHELRTPLTAIVAGSKAIEHATADARARDNARLILEAGDTMGVLLNDLLDLAKLEAGKMTVESTRFNLRGLVLDTVMFWDGAAARKGVRLGLSGAKALPAWVSGDTTRIRQIFNNLFSNAIKFTDAGSVTLLIRVEGQTVTFAVRDTGPGSSPEQIGRLFQPYAQADDSVARTHGGTGLGLSISLKLATAMGGALSAQSEPGAGATFSLSLPLPIAAQSDLAVTDRDAVAPAGALHILVVDDHQINRRAIALMLEPTGALVSLAESGAQALERLTIEPFDVVLMDVNMPGIDGYETTRRLRGIDGPNRAVPVLAITGSAEDRDLTACLAAGMSGRVIKPIQVRALFEALASLEADGPAGAPGERTAA